jgi:hypothetical protein
MRDPMAEAPTETSTLKVERPKRFAAESTSTQVTAAGGAGAAAAISGMRARAVAATEDEAGTATGMGGGAAFLRTGRVPAQAEPPPVPRVSEQPPPPPLQAVLESRVIANARTVAPPPPELSVDFAPWAMNATVNSAASAGVIAARPVVPPPAFLVELEPAKADDLRKVIAALTGQSKKNFTIESLIGAAAPESILATLSVRRVTTANVAFSKRAQQLTASGNEPALCLLRLERDERLLEARVVIRVSRPGQPHSAMMELTATAPTAIAEDLAAFQELRTALGSIWGLAKK